jgi:hypothetical protein
MAGSEIEIKARQLIWVDSEDHYESDNHVFKKGEEILILDPIRRKIGNGVSTFNELKFDTQHYNLTAGSDVSTLTLYNVIPQTTFAFKSSDTGITDIVFLLDSFKDSQRGFSQCDGRMHKIFVENTGTSDFEVEVSLTSLEFASSSRIIDIGTVLVAASSSILIEFCWLTNAGEGKVCYCRTNSGSQTPAPSSDSSIWKGISATRVSDTSFTVVGDQTKLFQKGLVVKWREGASTKLAMCTASTVSSVTTVTMIGDICSSTASEFKYCINPVEIIRFAVAGTIGMTGTDVANAYYTNYAIKIFGADIQVGAAGTTNSTTIDINKGGTSLFTNKPSLASTVAYSSSPFVADVNTNTAANNKITIDIDAVQSTPAVDLYVQLYVFQTRLLYIN